MPLDGALKRSPIHAKLSRGASNASSTLANAIEHNGWCAYTTDKATVSTAKEVTQAIRKGDYVTVYTNDARTFCTKHIFEADSKILADKFFCIDWANVAATPFYDKAKANETAKRHRMSSRIRCRARGIDITAIQTAIKNKYPSRTKLPDKYNSFITVNDTIRDSFDYVYDLDNIRIAKFEEVLKAARVFTKHGTLNDHFQTTHHIVETAVHRITADYKSPGSKLLL